jgi:hypothetical protein
VLELVADLTKSFHFTAAPSFGRHTVAPFAVLVHVNAVKNCYKTSSKPAYIKILLSELMLI